MAHVQLSPLIGFHARSSKDAPGFGFGLGSSNMSSQSWTTSPFQSTQASTLNQLASTSLFTNATHRPQKRRHEPEESENYRQDEVMDRSPTPERPKRAAPKRLRTIPSDSASKEDSTSSDSSSRHATEDKDIDIGVLLGTLSLLSHRCIFVVECDTNSYPSSSIPTTHPNITHQVAAIIKIRDPSSNSSPHCGDRYAGVGGVFQETPGCLSIFQ